MHVERFSNDVLAKRTITKFPSLFKSKTVRFFELWYRPLHWWNRIITEVVEQLYGEISNYSSNTTN